MYIVWSDVSQRYNIVKDYVNNSMDEVASIQYAEGELNTRVRYTVLNWSNNITAKDLSIDIAYARTQMYRDEDKYTAVMDRIKSITEALVNGSMAMVLDDGSTLLADKSSAAGKAHSTTADYHPVFDMGSELDMHVSSSQLQDEYDAKGYL